MPTYRPFDPNAYQIVVEPFSCPLRPEMHDTGVHSHRAYLFADDEDFEGMPEPSKAIAHVDWQLVRYSVAMDEHYPLIAFADDMSADLTEVTRVLFDEDDSPGQGFEGLGSELLYFFEIDVSSEFDFFEIARELLENVISMQGSGCFGAAYYRDDVPRLELERALLDRGFQRVEKEQVFFVSLEKRRPPLQPG